MNYSKTKGVTEILLNTLMQLIFTLRPKDFQKLIELIKNNN